jgi:hypothetical protein
MMVHDPVRPIAPDDAGNPLEQATVRRMRQ